MATTIAKRISPMLAVSDIDETLAFYRDVLGISPTIKTDGYLIMERDGQTVHLQKAASEEVMNCARGHAEIYIEVSNVGPLWQHVKTYKDRYRIRDLLTEFHIQDPNECLVFVGTPKQGVG
jgi:extradiol dioxygenase family protein